MTEVRHETNYTEGFYESELLGASDRNQYTNQPYHSHQEKRKRNKLLPLADYIAYQYKFTLIGWTEDQNISSRPTCALEASELKGEKRGMHQLTITGTIGMALNHT